MLKEIFLNQYCLESTFWGKNYIFNSWVASNIIQIDWIILIIKSKYK